MESNHTFQTPLHDKISLPSHWKMTLLQCQQERSQFLKGLTEVLQDLQSVHTGLA